MNGVRWRRFLIAMILIATAAGSAGLLSAKKARFLLTLLSRTVTRPEPPVEAFTPFHFVFLSFCVLLTAGAMIFAFRQREEGKDARTDRIVFSCGVAFFLLELYKQLLYYFVLHGEVYDFSVFPFQFCSLPIYLCLAAPILPWERARKTVYRFLALFGVVGGYLVMGYPAFSEIYALCIHSMLWHTLMIAIGGYLLIAVECGTNFRRDLVPTSLMFLLCFAIAIGLNFLLAPAADRTGTALNLFYMNPRYPTRYFLISDVRKAWGWGASLAAYAILFLTVGAFPLWILGRFLGIWRWKSLSNRKKQEKNKENL